MPPISLAITGAAGRMGKRLIALAGEQPEVFKVVSALEAAGSPVLGQDAGTLAGTAPIGVAVAGARLMKLDVMQTRMTIGIAASEASGLRKNVGSMGKPFHVGHGIRCGIFAALLAARGYTVDPNIIEGVEDGVEGVAVLDTQRVGLEPCVGLQF